MWSKYKACKNCGTVERPHKGKGSCNKCYGPAKQLDEINKWDQSRPETLKRYPGDANNDCKREFELLQEGYRQELKRRLGRIKFWEQSKKEPVTGIQLEYQLNRIAHRAGVQTNSLYHGYSGYIDWKLPTAKRKIVYKLLLKIEENIPWTGVDLYRILKYRSDRI